MVSSMVSLIMIVSLFCGSFVAAPVSDIKSGEIKFTAQTKLNAPLPEELADEFQGTDFDNMRAECDIRYKYSEPDKLEMQWDMLLSGVGEPIKLAFWGNLDFTDKNIPKTIYAFKEEKSDKYNVLNIQHPTISGSYKILGEIYNENTFADLGAVIGESIKTAENGDGKAVMSDEALKEVLRQITLVWSKALYKAYNQDIALIGETSRDDAPQINEFFDMLKGVQVFDKEALVLKSTYDNEGMPQNINYTINISTSLYDLMKALDGYVDDGWTSENTNIDLSIELNYNLSKLGEDLTIDYPSLTKENTIDLSAGQALPGINVNGINVVANGNLTPIKNKPFFDSGTLYVPLREMLNIKGLDNENIVWDNGVVKVETPYFLGVLTIGSQEIKINGESIDLGYNVILADGTTYVPAPAIMWLNIGSITNTFFAEDDNVTGCVISVYPFPPKMADNKMRFLIPEPEWEEYLIKAGDELGINVEVVLSSEENHLERTNLVIAAGDPMVIIGRFDDEFMQQMMEINAIHPPVKVNDEYSILIPKVVKNLDAAMAISKMFVVQILDQ